MGGVNGRWTALLAAWTIAFAVAAMPAAAAPRPVARGLGDFSADLYRKLRSGNGVVSPFSVANAFAGVYAGSAGTTQRQLGRALGSDGTPARFLDGLAAIDRQVAAEGAGNGGDAPQMLTANALWHDSAFTPRPAFARAIGPLGFEVRPTDFAHAPEASREAINQWGSEKTQGRIPEALPPRAVDEHTTAVLANATYFKARWADEFAPAATTPQAFHRRGARAVRVPMMHALRMAPYYATRDFQAVRLAYRGASRLALLVLVPRRSLGRVEARLSGRLLASIDAHLRSAYVRLALPKFEIRSSLDLKPPMRALGVTTAFGPAADLSPMFDGVRPGDLMLDQALQKTFMRVDEHGTEAAAVTVITVVPTSGLMPPSRAITVRADRPFLAILLDDRSDVPLFIARVVDPSTAPVSG